MQLHENRTETEKALLVSVDTGEFDAETSIDELEELAHTAGADVLGKLIQRRERIEAATFVGYGKLAEIIFFCENIMATRKMIEFIFWIRISDTCIVNKH